jgi:hypothetical protein
MSAGYAATRMMTFRYDARVQHCRNSCNSTAEEPSDKTKAKALTDGATEDECSLPSEGACQ